MKENTIPRSPWPGMAAGLYMALAYLIGITIFVGVLKYPEISDPVEKLMIMSKMPNMVFITNILMYVLFGPVLVLFIISLQKLIKNEDSILLKTSSVIGFIWAGSLTASGMISNAAIEPLLQQFAASPSQAVPMWQMIDAVAMGIGNGNAEILGGLMTLGFSVVMLKDQRFSKITGIVGSVVGVIGIITLLPILKDFTGLFGILQLVWFVLMAVAFFKEAKKLIK